MSRVVDDVISVFKRAGLPYLTKYSSRSEALRALADDDRASRRLFQIMEAKRLMNILILAAELNDTVRFKKFVERFRSLAEATVEPHRSLQLALIEELEATESRII